MITGKVNTVQFNSKVISEYIGKKTAMYMRRIGGYLRTVAKRSMRKRKGPSQPGTPPSAHENPLLKTYLQYAFNISTKKLVVGPVLLPRSKGSLILPGLMEHGGITFRQNVERKYAPRPFMKPALVKQGKNLLQNSLIGEISE